MLRLIGVCVKVCRVVVDNKFENKRVVYWLLFCCILNDKNMGCGGSMLENDSLGLVLYKRDKIKINFYIGKEVKILFMRF